MAKLTLNIPDELNTVYKLIADAQKTRVERLLRLAAQRFADDYRAEHKGEIERQLAATASAKTLQTVSNPADKATNNDHEVGELGRLTARIEALAERLEESLGLPGEANKAINRIGRAPAKKHAPRKKKAEGGE